jgi:hypothetical protein
MEDVEQGDLEDAQGIVLQMLKDLRHGNKPKDSSHLQTMDGALDLLQNCVALQMAQAELAGLAREKTMGNIVHHRILAMEAVLNIFLDEELKFTWTKASIVVAKSQGHGPTHACTF